MASSPPPKTTTMGFPLRRFLVFSLVAYSALTSIQFAHATTATVGTSMYPTINSALTVAAASASTIDTIEIQSGTYDEHLVINGLELHIKAADGAEPVITSPFATGNDDFMIEIKGGSVVTLTGLTLASTSLQNMLIRGSSTTVIMNDITCEQSISDCNDGGCIRIANGSSVEVTNSTFQLNETSDCSSSVSGGHLALKGASDLTVTNSTFLGGSAGYGGAIAILGGTASIHDSTFEDNTADKYGGAIYVEDSGTLSEVSGNTFHSNQAPDSLWGKGGAIYVDAPTSTPITLIGNQFTQNFAALRGGAVVIEDGDESILANNVFMNNSAENGGAIRLYKGVHLVLNNHFLANTVSEEGAHIRCSLCTLELTNNLIAFGNADDNAAIYSDSSTSNPSVTSQYNLYYSNVGGDVMGYTLDVSDIQDTNPALQAYEDGADYEDSYLLPHPTESLLIDHGDPSLQDPDGTVSDIGAFGGPNVNANVFADLDGDGFLGAYDCDDTDEGVYPGSTVYPDLDDDTWGDNQDLGSPGCEDATTLWSGNNLDCDPEDSSLSQDIADEYYLDQDEDGYGNPEVYTAFCDSFNADGWVTNEFDVPDYDFDCDDQDSSLEEDDLDGDGYSTCDGDCNDDNANIHPEHVDEQYDGIDSDCDGVGGPEDDEDQDGLSYTEEVHFSTQTDPSLADTDGDGRKDGLEYGIDVDPSDGIPDILQQCETTPSLTGSWTIDLDWTVPLDSDKDGIINALDPDDDGDDLPGAFVEQDEQCCTCSSSTDVEHWCTDTDGDYIPNPMDADDDNDGLTTADEVLMGNTDGDPWCNYMDEDDDGDTIPTSLELQYFSNPLAYDSDNDTISDGTEWGGTPPQDSDGDSTPDILDTDDDGDNIPTYLEGSADTDGDGIPNYLDLNSDDYGCTTDNDQTDLMESSDDIDEDTIPNYIDCDDTDGVFGDADLDGLINGDEIILGTQLTHSDSDGDTLPDGMEASSDSSQPLDTDGDGLIDALDDDDDDDTIPTEDEVEFTCTDESTPSLDDPSITSALIWSWRCANDQPAKAQDSDQDDVDDYLDSDDDNDGIPTAEEDFNGDGDVTNDDGDGDGEIDYLDPYNYDGPNADPDQDGWINSEEDGVGSNPYQEDSDNDTVSDQDEMGDPMDPTDTDGDGTYNILDPDDDDDGILTEEEGAFDIDEDGIPNYLDLDSDGDGVDDAQEGTNDVDCDGLADFMDEADLDGPCAIDTDDTGTPTVIEEQGCQGCHTSHSPFSWMPLSFLILLSLTRRRFYSSI